MSKDAELHIRVNKETKNAAERLFSSFGLTVTDAVSMFLHKALMVGGIPFDLVQPRYNTETETAMQEVNAMIRGQSPRNSQDVKTLFEELDIDVNS
jgi:DNA-damage-inducible protein J